MRKAEAMALVGQQVKVWTAANGEYVGTLEAVFGPPGEAAFASRACLSRHNILSGVPSFVGGSGLGMR